MEGRLLPVFFFVFLSFPCRGSQGRGPLAAAALSVRRLFCRPAALRRCRPAGGSLPGPTAAGAPPRPAITTRLCREGRKVCPPPTSPPPPVIHDVHMDIPHRRRGVWRERSWIGVSPRALTEELCAFPRRCGGPPPGAVGTPPYRALYDIWLLPTPRVAAPPRRPPFPAHTRPEATVAMGVLAKKHLPTCGCDARPSLPPHQPVAFEEGREAISVASRAYAVAGSCPRLGATNHKGSSL